MTKKEYDKKWYEENKNYKKLYKKNKNIEKQGQPYSPAFGALTESLINMRKVFVSVGLWKDDFCKF